MKTSRLLLDGDILAYRTCWAAQTEVQWDDGIVTTGTNLRELEVTAKQSMDHWKEKLGLDEMVVAFSDPRGRYFRHNILEDYKGNRKSTKKPLGYKHLVKHIHENYTTMVLPECEADDVLGILATDGTHDDTIVSIDKDMLTIPGKYYNMDTEITETITAELADYMHLYQTLVGDSTDNYKGCPGVGPKKAAEILRTPTWPQVLLTFISKGFTEADALVQAQVARILRADDYDFTREEVVLWEPLKI
jgi:DNA polymerase I